VAQNEFSVTDRRHLRVERMLGSIWRAPDVITVGGYVTQLLGHMPSTGEKTRIEDFDIVITRRSGRRVAEVHFKRAADA